MRWGGHFPFLQTAPLSPLPSGYWVVEGPYCGILSDYPLVWLALGRAVDMEEPAGGRGLRLTLVCGGGTFAGCNLCVYALPFFLGRQPL